MNKSHITLLKKQIKKLDVDDFDLEAWKVSAELLLTEIFDRSDPKTVAIRNLRIDYSSTMLRDSNANYQPIETCKSKGRGILELAIDQLEMSLLPDSELKQLLDRGDKQELETYLKKMKKEDLVDLLLQVLK